MIIRKDKRIIGVVTSARADYGILKSTIESLSQDRGITLQLYVTASHLLKKFGNSAETIRQEYPNQTVMVRTATGHDSLLESCTVVSRGSRAFARQFLKCRPDIIVLVGDRYEIIGPAAAALLFQIPIAHIHGGERTDGAVDELVRHAITKLSTYHFVATEIYRKRIIQMGEDPSRVWNYGAPALDLLVRESLLSRPDIEKYIGLKLDKPTALVTFHPETACDLKPDCRPMLKAIKESGVQAVFTQSNADPGNSVIHRQVSAFVKQNPARYVLLSNLGAKRYFSCIKHCGVLIGNSSSGLIEAPSLNAAVVNIGDRQAGRVRSKHIIDCKLEEKAIEKAIKKAFSVDFRKSLKKIKNPYQRYSDGKAGERIKQKLCKVPLKVKRNFVDLF